MISYAALGDAPVLVAANREERFGRDALPPHLQTGRPRTDPPPQPPSRGVLCRELLNCLSADEAFIVRGPDRGTVSCDRVALTTVAGPAVYRHAPGPPDRQAYQDCSALLLGLLHEAEGN